MAYDKTNMYGKDASGNITTNVVSTLADGLGESSTVFEESVKPLVRANGLIRKTDDEFFHKFSRFGYLDPYARVTGTREYVFFTKPDLFLLISNGSILSEFCKTSFFINCMKTNKESLLQLQDSATNYKYPFMNLLSNAKRSNLELPGISVGNDIETSANMYDTKLSYRGTSYSSDENYEFSMEFEDTRNLDVYMLFKAYDEYERRKYYGYYDLYDTSKNNGEATRYIKYAVHKIIHDQFSIFKFIVAEDGSTILYYAKLYGVYPKNVPRDAFSDMPESGDIRFTINFKANIIEDSDPAIIEDFNTLVNYKPGTEVKDEMKLYDPSIGAVSGEWANTPYIVMEEGKDFYNRRRFKLKWR